MITTKEKIIRTHQRIEDWKALRDSKDNQMGAYYVDMQLQEEYDRLKRLEEDLSFEQYLFE
jgi:hypothetical protein